MEKSIQRERKVNLKDFPKEEANRIADELSLKVAQMVNATKEEVNSLLKIYGYEASFVVNFHDLNGNAKTLIKPKKQKTK